MAKEKKSTVKSASEPIETESFENSPENTGLPEEAVEDTTSEGEPGEDAEDVNSEDKTGENTEDGENPETAINPENEHSGEVLKATRLILYRGRLYDAGDELPADDQHDVEEWLKFKSAAWLPVNPERGMTAKPVSAVPGRDGLIANGQKDIDGNNLVGRVPKTAARNKK